MTTYKLIASLIAFVGISLLTSCNYATKGGEDEGQILYSVTPVEPENVMSSLAPSSMTLKFKNDKIIAEMQTGMSTLGIKYISDNKKSTISQLVRILNQKYACKATAKNLNTVFKKIPEYDIQIVDEFKTIADINCQRAMVFEKGTTNYLFDVYFTDAFKLSKPNWWNEFAAIDGLLMEYQMKRFNLELRFTAQKFDQIQVDPSEFTIKGDHVKISEDELESYFEVFK